MGAVSRKALRRLTTALGFSHRPTDFDIEESIDIASTANCFPRLLNLDIVYIISSLPRLPHVPFSLRKNSIILPVTSSSIFTVFLSSVFLSTVLLIVFSVCFATMFIGEIKIHSFIKTVSSLVVYLTFDDYNMTVMMICSRDDNSTSAD